MNLVAVNLRRDLKGALFSAFGVAVGVGSLVFFAALGLGVNKLVREKIFPVDARALEVVPASLSLSSLIGGGKLDEAAFARLQALDGVEGAYRKLEMKIPAMAAPAEALARTFRVPARTAFAAIVVGVEPSFVAGDLAPGMRFDDPGAPEGDAPPKPIPAMASRRLLDLYNRSFAKAQGLTPIPEALLNAAKGVELIDLRLGRSLSGATKYPEGRASLSFAGLSEKGPIHAILVPIDAVRRIHRQYGLETDTWSAVTLVARSPDQVPTLAAKVREMGFAIDESAKTLSERVGAAIAVATSALALLSALICLIAGANIAHALSASVRARAREIALLRAVGATRGEVARLVLSEAALIGLGGGLAGALVAWLLGTILDLLARRWLPELPIESVSFFAFGPWLFLGAAALGVLAAVAGALFPARAAAREPPARALVG